MALLGYHVSQDPSLAAPPKPHTAPPPLCPGNTSLTRRPRPSLLSNGRLPQQEDSSIGAGVFSCLPLPVPLWYPVTLGQSPVRDSVPGQSLLTECLNCLFKDAT